jgi:uncharacterized protein YjbI with pentapeptide repeats
MRTTMYRRRTFLSRTATSILSAPILTACSMTTRKKSIREFGKIFEYLKDPELRNKETGTSLLLIEAAEFSGEDFQYVDWHNITFKSCDFIGAYQIKLSQSTDLHYEDCRFSGIFGYGKSKRVRFLRCAWTDGSVAFAGEQSTDVVFESCLFVGVNSNPNHWGAVGSDGDAEFIKCTARMFNLAGHANLTIRECQLEDVSCSPQARESGGVFANARIENSELRGEFDMVNADLESLTLRDTTIAALDLTNATIKGDILMERIKGGSVKAIVKGARRITVKDCQFMPPSNEKFVFALAGDKVTEVLVENTSIVGDGDMIADIGGGPKSVSTVFRDSRISRLDLQYIHTAHLTMQNVVVGTAQLSGARIGTMELDSASFDQALDLSGAQILDFKLTGTTDLKKLGRNLKLDGSNIKLPK